MFIAAVSIWQSSLHKVLWHLDPTGRLWAREASALSSGKKNPPMETLVVADDSAEKDDDEARESVKAWAVMGSWKGHAKQQKERENHLLKGSNIRIG